MLLGLDWRAEREGTAEQGCAEQVWETELAWGHEEIVAGMVWVTSPRRRKDLTQRAQRGEHRDHREERAENLT